MDELQKLFENIYATYRDSVYRFIFFRVKNVDTTEDITQSVFLKLYEKRDTLPEIRQHGSYVFMIARNAVIDYWRKKKSISLETYLESSPEPEDTAPNPEAQYMSKESSELVKKLLSNLSHEQQDILVMKYVTGLSNKEIAEITGKSEDAIRQIQSRAIRTLRSHHINYE